jgi:hypothetical protein
LAAFYPGEAGGTAVADVLVGDYNPGGRLPITFYAATSKLADFSDYDGSAHKGRTYRYYTGTLLYLFGHGLSYTQFAYSKPTAEGNAAKGGVVHVKFAVTNTGARAGDEVVQVYVSSGRAGEPLKSLKYFKRVNFAAGSVETSFDVALPPSAFTIFNERTNRLEVGGGKFTISVGGTSASAAQQSVEAANSQPVLTRTSSPSWGGFPATGPTADHTIQYTLVDPDSGQTWTAYGRFDAGHWRAGPVAPKPGLNTFEFPTTSLSATTQCRFTWLTVTEAQAI